MIEQYKTRHLILLVGTNPLPNYIAGKLLVDMEENEQDPYRIHFVCTDKSMVFAKHLEYHLKPDNEALQCDFIEVKDSDPDDIRHKIEKILPQTNSIGLNYTGGTKAMAVHAYEAVKARYPNAVMSYLDARTLQMIIKEGSQVVDKVPVGHLVNISLGKLLDLHHYEFLTTRKKGVFLPGTEPKFPQIARVLSTIPVNELRQWFEDNCQDIHKEDDEGKIARIKNLRLPQEGPYEILKCVYGGATTFEELAEQLGTDALNTWKYFDGFWLEDHVLMCLKRLQPECTLDEIGMNVRVQPKQKHNKTPGINFEFDNYAIRGYRLFGISCTTASWKAMSKQKLFEAYVRTTQMGGDEARVGVVCGTDRPDLVQAELEEIWDAHGKIAVWGARDIPYLEERLKIWFNQ